jgi:hypothetical protein
VLVSFTIIVGLLFAQLVQLSDLLLFQHYACEHGELAHAHTSDAAPSVATPPSQGEEPQAVAARGEGEHEHCDAMAIRQSVDALALHVPEATILGCIDAPALATGSSQRPIALLAVAPKASPPRG